jgi:hypothetical protein
MRLCIQRYYTNPSLVTLHFKIAYKPLGLAASLGVLLSEGLCSIHSQHFFFFKFNFWGLRF